MEIFTSTTFLFNFIRQKGWPHIPEEYQLFFGITAFIVQLITLTIVFYIAGIIVVGKRRALLSDAFVISLLGTVVGIICDLFFPALISVILSLLVWLLLIRHYYETGWLGALAVGILAVIIAVVVSLIVLFILALLLGFAFVLSGWLALFSAL